MMQATHRSNIKLYLVLLIFILPALLSSLLFHYHDRFQFKTTNHGTLINPPLNVATIVPQEHKWRIMCIQDSSSNTMLMQLNQVKKALGKDRDRVSVICLNNHLDELSKLFQQIMKTDFIMQNQIYLIDPRDHLFMYYPSDTNLMNVLKDMKHLLGVSQIG